jgi:hypothetical protein
MIEATTSDGGLPMITSKAYGKIIFILIVLMSLTVWLAPSLAIADDDKKGHNYFKKHEIRKEHNDQYDDKREGNKDDEGNEATGQTAAWLLVAANMTVILSILMKGVNRFFPLKQETESSIKRFNQFQKKYLMRFHYVLNPVALCIAIFHFLLSSCRSSPLPEWGLILVTVMVFLGLMVKFKVTPKWMRRFVYRLHTGLATLSIMIILLVVGHLIVD